MPDARVIEAMLLRWGETCASGRTVTFLLPEEGGVHPFKGLKYGPVNGQRVALSVALIAEDETTTPAMEKKEKRSFDELPRSQQAGILCNEGRFQRYLGFAPGTKGVAYSSAAHVRHVCGVKSRAELDTSPTAAGLWDDVVGHYEAWKAAT